MQWALGLEVGSQNGDRQQDTDGAWMIPTVTDQAPVLA